MIVNPIKAYRYSKVYKTIKNSGLFDSKYYLSTYHDIKVQDIDPIKHYIKYGAKEGRNPSAHFDTKFYLKSYQDVTNAGINPLVHFIIFGQSEGRLAKKSFQSLSFEEPWVTHQTSIIEDVSNLKHANILNIFESMLCHSSTTQITIITPKHTLFVAHLLYKKLTETGFEVQIETTLPSKFNDNLHIMICPQIFDRMPGLYIAFQMEQLMNSQWFNAQYRMILQNSIAIFDYSIQNIEYLQKNGFTNKHLYLLPIAPFKGYRQFLRLKDLWGGGTANECDVLFYGDTNNEHRQNYLRALQQKFSVKIINEVFGNDLYRELLSAKVIVNIHYYENALLETTRIYECLSLGLRVVSEESSDMEEHLGLLNKVDFVRMGDIDHMIEKISKVLDEDTKKEKVSVVIPCYNQAAYIQETVQSVFEQTYPNLEIIIVNDGSTDESEQIIQEISLSYPNKNIHLLNQENKGVSEARNSGIRVASGNYVFLLDADDKLHPTMISKSMYAMDEHQVDIVYADYQRFGEDTTIQKTRDKVELYFLQYANITGATALYKKSVWEKTGGYKQNMDMGYEDWEFWVNAGKNNFKFYHIPQVLFYYRVKKVSRDIEAIKKDTYLKAKIVMNHPELYTSYQLEEAIRTIKETEKLPDIYFYASSAKLLDNKQILLGLSDYLRNHNIDEKSLLNTEDYKIGICPLDLFEGPESVKQLSDEMNADLILFYAPLRYTIPSLSCQNKVWKSTKGFMPLKGSIFKYVTRSKRENTDTQLLAYQRSEKYLQERCLRLEHRLKKPNYHLQLFLNLGNSYNETDSLKLPVAQHNQLQTFSFDLSGYQQISNLRLDPLNENCVIEIEAFTLTTSNGMKLDLKPNIHTNACSHQGKKYFFESLDPQIHFHGLRAEKLSGAVHFHATLRYIHIARDALHACVKQIQTATDTRVKNQDQQIKKLKDELLLAHISKQSKYTQILRKFKKFTRTKK